MLPASLSTEYNIRILFAVESGSRAWGFASPDSDYDVRFVFVHPRERYLAITEVQNDINRDYPGDLDVNGWELRKALKLGWKGNPALFEWLHSPIVYEGEDARQAMREVLLPFFRPQGAIHHYLGIARSAQLSGIQDGEISIKKYFYILRPVLAAVWIARHQSPPPVEFQELLPLVTDEGLLQTIHDLLDQKRIALEQDRIPLIPEIERALETWKSEAESFHPGPGDARPSPEPLNEFFRKWLI